MRQTIAIIAFLCGPVLCAADLNVDVTPFGRVISDGGWVGIQWSEMRRIARLEIAFAGGAQVLPEQLRVEYWHKVWDGGAIRRYADQGAGGVGWAAMDDWHNGQWKLADGVARATGRNLTFTFAPSDQKEFPALKKRGVAYRPTLKIRVSAAGAKIASLEAYTDSTWRNSDLSIRFQERRGCDEPLEVDNGKLISKTAAASGGECVLRAGVAYAFNPDDVEADRTIVTVRSAANPFSFAVDEAERGDRIYVKDFGVLVTRVSDPVTIAEYARIIEESGAKSIYDRVADEPEQTLAHAWQDMPLKPPYYFILGCEGGRQRFRMEPNGDLWMNRPSHPRKGGRRDIPTLLWPEPGVKYRFGLPESRPAERSIAAGYLPIVTTKWVDGDLLYEQEAFADVLAGNLNTAPPMQAGDPTVALLRVRMVNNAAEPRQARLVLSTESQGEHGAAGAKFETLRAEGDSILGSYQGQEALRYLVDTGGAGTLANSAGGVVYTIELPARREHTLYLKAPFVSLTETSDRERLRALNFERERAAVARYWEKRVAAGSEIRTPEPWLNDFYKAHVVHLLINDERELGSDSYVARVGSFHYGAYGNESIMMISDLDRRGYHKEAERSLELFLRYQGSVELPGTYRTKQGVLYGAGGYEAGGYNQHHGWILWGLGEHYWHTRDRTWMKRAAPGMVDACRWIESERKATQVVRDGQRVPEYGLLPAGSLEDVTDYWFWLSTNSFSWSGFANAAAALKDYGHPDGDALVAEAERYRQDILAAFREAMVRSPVARLRDGTYVPIVPSNVYTRGRSYGWLRETLEGAIMLPVTRLLDPNSREAQWILKDYEDNRYVSDRFGYAIPTFDRFWFSRGGFSMQPNLLHGPLPYFFRDEIRHFVRAYFNPFAAGYDPGLRMLPEHPLPELGYIVGDHFKSSDESQSTYWLRLMFAAELDGVLHLGRGIPRYWLNHGNTIGIRNASTYFGPLSYDIVSEEKNGSISMVLDPPTRNVPGKIVVRFRHPRSKEIRRVTVDGSNWTDFDPAKGDIWLPGKTKVGTKIVAEY